VDSAAQKARAGDGRLRAGVVRQMLGAGPPGANRSRRATSVDRPKEGTTMGANLNVTYHEMSDAATRLRDGQQQIESQLEALKKLVDSLVNGGYVTDSSSKAFDTSYTEFNDGARKTIQGLDGMGRYLDRAAQTFQAADEQLASALKG
jgi:WXG100 family type VII secretion target